MDLKDKQVTKNSSFLQSFKHALTGVFTVIKLERNMKYHIISSVLALLIGYYLTLSVFEWLWILLAISLVLFAEIVNTSFEHLVDLTTDYQYHPLAKRVKDMAAGGVLIIAIFAVIVGCLIFLPKLWQIVQ